MSKLIKFLRITIQQIELKILEQNKKNTETLNGIKNQLSKEENKLFANFRREIEEAKALHAAQAGPAAEEPNSNDNFSIGKPKKPPSYLLTNNELRGLGINPNGSSSATNPPTNLSKIPPSMLKPVGRQRNFKPTQPPHNSQKPPTSTNNLIAKLEALKND